MYRLNDATAELLHRPDPLVTRSACAVVVERVARGGGATRWFACQTLDDVRAVLPQLRPGGRVGFFFDDRIRRTTYSDTLEEEIWSRLSRDGELFLGRERPPSLELEIELLDLRDCSESLARVRNGEVVYLGAFPTFEDDGHACVVFTPPDPDGVVRPQPV